MAHYGRAIELARRDGVGESGVTLRELYLRRGRAIELLAQHREALANYEAMEAEGIALGDRTLEMASLMEQAKLHVLPTEISDSKRVAGLLDRALVLARATHDEAAEARILWNTMIAYRFDSRLDEAVEHGEHAIAIARQVNAREQLAYTLNDISEVYMMQGRMERAKEVLREASDLWRELGNVPMLTDNLNRLAANLYWTGEFARGVELSNESHAISERIGNRWGLSFSFMFAGPAMVELGRVGEAIRRMHESIRIGAEVEYRATQIITRGFLGRLYAELGCLAEAITLTEQAQDNGPTFDLFGPGVVGILAEVYLLAGRPGDARRVLEASPNMAAVVERNPMFNTDYYIGHAHWLMADGQYQAALVEVEPVIQRQYRTGLRKDLLTTLRIKAQALAATGQFEGAAATLVAAQAEAERLGGRWSLWQILAERATLAVQSGDAELARTLRAPARDLVNAIASSIDDESLRATWLATAKVKELFVD